MQAQIRYKYSYDQNGNITEIRDANNVVQYKYTYDDPLGQLSREDNRPLGKTYVYTYDFNGNRRKKEAYDFTLGTIGTVRKSVEYNYDDSGWRDLLTKIGSNTNVTYDDIGNPVRIGDYTLTWEGRELRSRFDGQYEHLSFGYNSEGIRVYKEEYEEEPGYTVRHEYTVSSSRIIKETVYYDGNEKFTLVFSYDENGSPIGYRFRRPNYPENVYDCYYYDKNLQGDIVSVYGSSGNLLVSYVYDAWGSCYPEYTNEGNDEYLDNSGEFFNPFRYRGYYYDEETGLYYLNSRYYNPQWGRFLNPDCYLNANGDILGFNMFAYCGNNPVMGYDPSGENERFFDSINFGGGAGAISSVSYCVPIVIVGVGVSSPKIWQAISSFCDSVTIAVSGVFSKTDSKAEEKSKEKEEYKNNNYNDRYWLAELINNKVVQITPLSYSDAFMAVADGKNIVCIDQIAAMGIVKYYPSRILDERHGPVECGYLNHYHLNSAHTNHVWFYGGILIYE